MKRPLATRLLVFLFSVAFLAGANGADDSKAIEKLEVQIKEDINKRTKVKAAALTSKALARCYAAEFYKVEVSEPLTYRTATIETVFVKTPGGMVKLELPILTSPMPQLLNLVNPAFTIKSEEDAMLLLKSFGEIYQVLNLRYNHNLRVIQIGKTWLLITDETGGHLWGFEADTDDTGKITAIRRNNDIIAHPDGDEKE